MSIQKRRSDGGRKRRRAGRPGEAAHASLRSIVVSTLFSLRFISLLAVFACASTSFAQPSAVSRTLRSIDFEERKLGNVEDLPMHWLKVEGAGLPHYVNGRLSTDRARSGDYSFRFDLNGGSLIYRYDPRQIPVQAGAHYRVEAFAQTTPLPHARARMTAYFTDVDFHPIESSIQHSELWGGRREEARGQEGTEARAGEQGEWRELSINLSAEDPRAAYLCIELELLQPAYFKPQTLGTHELLPQDIRGSAWFDDVSVAQVPHVELSTEAPGNIFRRGRTPQLLVRVNDRFMEDLSAQLRVTDAAGNEIYQHSGALDMTSAKTVGPGTKQLTLDLPDLPAGWYRTSLAIQSRGRQLGEKSLELIRLADDGVVPPDGRFGVIATDLPPSGWGLLPDVLPYLSAGRVKLALWSKTSDIQRVDSDAFDRLLERLGELGITPTGCLIEPPPGMAERIGGDDWSKLLSAPLAAWQPELAYLIARHANHLDRWQLGEDGTSAFVSNPAMRQVYDKVYAEFAKLVPHPDLAMPWPAWYELDAKNGPATVALSVPTSVLPEQLPLYIRDSGSGIRNSEGGSHLSLSLQLLDAKKYGRTTRIRDMVERIVFALAGGASRIDVPLPMTVEKEGKQLICRPDEMLAVLHTVLGTLSGATYRGKVPIAEGVEAFLFDQHGRGIMVLWDKSNAVKVKQLPLRLGDRPVRLDLWGNATPLLQAGSRLRDSGSGNDAGTQSESRISNSDSLLVNLGPMPIFLLDIDGRLAQMRASVGIDRPLLESSFEPHHRHLHFTNPYPQAISGTVKLIAPPGWNINPPTSGFNLNPGETFDRELTIEFPYNSYAGTKSIQARFSVQADRLSTFTVPITLRLGLSDVGMRSLALRDGGDVIVQQIISNYGDKPINYNAFAIVPGQARQERLVINLGPGKTTIKRYRFGNVTLPPSERIRVGIKEISGTRILNDELEIR
jgi:hypothetical protein